MKINKKHTDVVIILVNFNGFSDTKKCVKSIIVNDKVNCQIVIVDNSPIHEKSLVSLAEQNDCVSVVRQSENLGFGAANNFGVNWANKHFDYQYILLLNNDTEIQPGAISTMVSSFDTAEDIGIVTCKTTFYDNPKLIWYGGGDINFFRGIPILTDYQKNASQQGANLSRYVKFASGCVMLFKKNIFQKLEGFDDNFFMYVEDVELSIRCLKHKIKIWYNKDAVVLHKVNGSFKNDNEFRGIHHLNSNIVFHFYHRKLNQWIAFRKHLSGLRFFKFAIVYFSEFFYSWIKLLVLSPKRIKLLSTGISIISKILFNRYKSRSPK